MLIMNKDGMKHLLSSEFALGADASVAAGPVGRHAEGNTDWKMRAEVLTYSRARGLFAGVSLDGAVLKQDKDSTREFYGRMVPFRTSLTGEIEPPDGANAFLEDAGEVGARSGEVGKRAKRASIVSQRARHIARLAQVLRRAKSAPAAG